MLHRDPGVGQPSQGKVELCITSSLLDLLFLNYGLDVENSSKCLHAEATMTLVHTGMDNRPTCCM